MPDLAGLDHEAHVERAIALAREAGERGDGPYGSLLVVDGDVVMEETNREWTDDDIALHPELTLARRAARELTAEERDRAVMYTSTEPCPMCSGGITISNLGAVVYSVSGERAAAEFGGNEGVPCGEVFERRGRDIEVVGGVLESEGLDVHREFRDA
ncbi:nucleoside deaminase [Halogeometricum limi]|uniref:tRNA(Arg) A34 adenosine deaminase TadA n=1 Tax=Halogeometricum limi TaxID=555875 RepID=A0A1I6ICF5_9EURY|nr:nucleoside deaminase [Halogeometricum limi]SFR64465.1 tRNA(Arg) A34 adenosine deaminase TadA [Halogeometricum limi]